MLYINANEEKRLNFEVDIHGVESKELTGSVRLNIYGVEYGFPVTVEDKKISTIIFPLTEIVGKEIEDGTVIEGKLELFTDRHYFRPWIGEIKIGAPMQIKATLSDVEKSRPGISTKLLTADGGSGPLKNTTISNESNVDSNVVEQAVLNVLKRLNIGKEEDHLNEFDNIIEEQLEKKMTPKPKIRTTQKPKQEQKKSVTKADLQNISEAQIYQYIARAGTKKKQIQDIIFEQASAGAKNNLEVLKNVVKIMKKNKV